MSMFPKFVKMIKSADNTALCGAVNHACDNQCLECPFGSEAKKKHVDNSLDMISLIMADSFRQDDEPME